MDISNGGTTDIKVVLLCKGKGSDPDSFQPNRDETQWWSRRDALVRCISSFLLGPKQPIDAGSRELIMLFDDDNAKIHMTLDTGTPSILPTEQKLLAIMKQSSQKPNQIISQNGLKCIVIVDPTRTDPNIPKEAGTLPKGLGSKRQVLEYLQKNCSIDFLRSNRLNSNIDVVLRKTNKKKLMEVWNSWRENYQKETSSTSQSSSGYLEMEYSKILEGKDNIICGGSDKDAKIIAGTLHETSEEFPCFGLDNKKYPKHSLVYFFLGAVRDMTAEENQVLTQVCRAKDVPFFGVRFGTIPEFTSKILSILAFHHSENVLGKSLRRIRDSSSKVELVDGNPSPPRTCLHVISLVPLDSTDISTDLKHRNYVHWSLVRIIVCTLWRSKLVSSDTSLLHTNFLHLAFKDGMIVSLQEEDFVRKMGEQHQAAPSEYQILNALKEVILNGKEAISENRSKKKARKVLDRIAEMSSIPIQGLVISDENASREIRTNFYSTESTLNSQRNVVLVQCIGKENENTSGGNKLIKALLAASAKKGIPSIKATITEPSIDVGAVVTCMQQFCYQDRIYIDRRERDSRKRKAI